MAGRERAHVLVAALREAHMDDEPLTEEDLKALEQAREDVAQGRLISHAEIRRRFLCASIESRKGKRL
jgi:hypothetical protein